MEQAHCTLGCQCVGLVWTATQSTELRNTNTAGKCNEREENGQVLDVVISSAICSDPDEERHVPPLQHVSLIQGSVSLQLLFYRSYSLQLVEP